jgi:hypothetical protein
MFFPETSGNWRVTLFGGPTYFTVSQQMVETIRYDQRYFLSGTNIVDITTYNDKKASGSGFGFHAGADVSYFFTRVVGIGGTLRFNTGTVTIDEEPLTGEKAELKAGHATLGFGLRLRF